MVHIKWLGEQGEVSSVTVLLPSHSADNLMLLMFFYIVSSFTTCEMPAADHLCQFKDSS